MGKVIAGTVAVFVAVALIVVGGWKLHWWLAQASTDNAAHINRSSYGNQQTLRDRITDDLSTVDDISTQITENPAEAAQLKAQRHAMVDKVCREADAVTGDSLPNDQVTFVSANCLNGSTNPSSVYAQN